MKHLFVVQASFGHLLPAMRLADLVLERGHETLFIASDQYSGLLDLYGLEHVPVSNVGHPFLSTYDWYDANTVGIQVKLLSQMVEQYRPEVLVTCPLGLATFMVAELYSVPVVVLGYGEYLYPGLHDEDPTRWWRLRTLTSFYNECRKGQGLAPVDADPETTPLLGSRYLLRNVPEFTAPCELPSRVCHVGGLYWEPPYRDPKLERFLEASQKRYQRCAYVQVGRLFNKPWVWTRLMNALHELGVACVADTGRADYLEHAEAFPNCFMTRFVPIGSVQCADAVICSGHTAAVLGAITHRKPILCVPTSADAEECAIRVSQCGLGAKIDYQTELDCGSLRRFFERADRDDFCSELTRFRAHLDDWKRAEVGLGDVALSLAPELRKQPVPVGVYSAPQV